MTDNIMFAFLGLAVIGVAAFATGLLLIEYLRRTTLSQDTRRQVERLAAMRRMARQLELDLAEEEAVSRLAAQRSGGQETATR